MVRAAVLIGDEFDHITEVPAYQASSKRFVQYIEQKTCSEVELYEFSVQQYVWIAGGNSYIECPLPEHGVTPWEK